MAAAVQQAVSRNDPCPCGSGRRFKDCHGSIRASLPPAAPPVRKSRYRPAGADWASLAEDNRDRLGAWMERALKEQVEQRPREAERLYRAVLEEAPHTHDALHMLGVIRLGLGDFVDAEQLIQRAMALRPEYPAIASNWALVRRTIDARDRRGVETVAEHALPLLFESLGVAARAPSSVIDGDELHIVGPEVDPDGDAGWRMRRLRDLLAPLQPQCWNAPRIATGWEGFDRHAIETPSGRRPRAGRVMLLGVEGETDWLREPIGDALVFIQRSLPSTALEQLRRIAADGARSLTLVFDSHAKARRFGLDRHVLPPPIDAAELSTLARSAAPRDPDRLRVAMVGQDGRRVVAPVAAAALVAIADAAGELCVIDPGPLRFVLGTARSVFCVPRDAPGVAAAIAGSDLYWHRPQPWWSEDSRPLFEAMLLGVPALCPRTSLYGEYIADGIDGWLYDDDAAAQALVTSLRKDRARLRSAGEAARRKALERFDPRALAAAYRGVVSEWMQSR